MKSQLHVVTAAPTCSRASWGHEDGTCPRMGPGVFGRPSYTVQSLLVPGCDLPSQPEPGSPASPGLSRPSTLHQEGQWSVLPSPKGSPQAPSGEMVTLNSTPGRSPTPAPGIWDTQGRRSPSVWRPHLLSLLVCLPTHPTRWSWGPALQPAPSCSTLLLPSRFWGEESESPWLAGGPVPVRPCCTFLPRPAPIQGKKQSLRNAAFQRLKDHFQF